MQHEDARRGIDEFLSKSKEKLKAQLDSELISCTKLY